MCAELHTSTSADDLGMCRFLPAKHNDVTQKLLDDVLAAKAAAKAARSERYQAILDEAKVCCGGNFHQ